MKFDLSQTLVSYNGKQFTRPVVENGVTRDEPTTLRDLLEVVCVNADPQQHSDGAKKMLIFNLLMKVHNASPSADFTAEELTLLKELVGKQLTIPAVGAIYAALEKPLSNERPE
jgi:hypothetical protein